MNKRESYLLEALLELATVHPTPLTVAELGRRRALPVAFLARLLAAAARHGIVATSRGPHGGIALARDPAALPLAIVLETVLREPAGSPATRWLARELARTRDALLADLTLADLAARERETAAFSFAI